MANPYCFCMGGGLALYVPYCVRFGSDFSAQELGLQPTPSSLRGGNRSPCRDRLFTDIFPNRTEFPKTLVFAKNESHAEDITVADQDHYRRLVQH